MSTHNICFHGEIRKILCGYPLLSVAMIKALLVYFPSYNYLQKKLIFRTLHLAG